MNLLGQVEIQKEEEEWSTFQGPDCTTISIQNRGQICVSISDETVTMTYEETTVQVTAPKSVAFCDGDPKEETVVELRVIPKREARTLIIDYLKLHPGVWTSDIIYELGLDLNLVLEILEELKAEGKARSRTIEVEQ